MKYIKNCLLTIASSISLAAMIGCSEEERLPTEEDLIVAQEWLECTQQEKWEKAYEQVGLLGTKTAIRNECGAEPPFVPDE